MAAAYQLSHDTKSASTIIDGSFIHLKLTLWSQLTHYVLLTVSRSLSVVCSAYSSSASKLHVYITKYSMVSVLLRPVDTWGLMPTLTSPEQSSCIKTMLRGSVEIQVPVPGYMAWLSYMNSCSWCHGVQKDLGCTVTVQLGLCFKMKYHQRRSAPHPSCYGIDFLRTTGPCCLHAHNYSWDDTLFVFPVKAGPLYGRELKSLGWGKGSKNKSGFTALWDHSLGWGVLSSSLFF